MLFAAVVGNSTIRHALLEGGSVLGRGVLAIPPDGSPLAGGWLPRGTALEAVLVGSVNPGRLEELLSLRRALPARVLVAGRDLPIPIPNRYRDPAQVGIDRLLNALAASRLFPGRGSVVLDFGTALSVSVVSPAGEFLGGPIAAGLRCAAEGLSRRTAQLPRVELDRPPERFLARSTEEAIRAGIWAQVAGGAGRILEGLAAELPFPVKAIATGGDAALFAPAVPRIEAVDPDLALKGLAIAYEQFKGR